MRYRGNLRTATVLELMLLDSDNPRSLICGVDEVRDSAHVEQVFKSFQLL